MSPGKHLSLTLLAFAALLAPGLADPPDPVADRPPVETAAATSGAEFGALLESLDHRLFAERERATDALLAKGAAAVPHLAEAVEGGSLEAADRAVWILRQFANTGEEDLQLDALEVLAAADRFPLARRQAEAALAELYQLRCQQRLESLGANFTVTPDPGHPRGRDVQVVVNTAVDNWRGEPDDLLVLTTLRTVARMKITAPGLNDRHIEKLASIDGLAYLELVETEATFDKVEQLKQQHRGLRIVLRSRVKLGVGFGLAGTLVVTQVQPGTPAERAGIEVGDRVIGFAGHAVDDFDRLTARIAQHAPGDQVDITVLRNGQEVKLSAKLIANDWSTEDRP